MDAANHGAPQRDGADSHIRGINTDHRRKAPADAHEHADDEPHARMPEKKGDHTEPENKEKESHRSLHLDTLTNT